MAGQLQISSVLFVLEAFIRKRKKNLVDFEL